MHNLKYYSEIFRVLAFKVNILNYIYIFQSNKTPCANTVSINTRTQHAIWRRVSYQEQQMYPGYNVLLYLLWTVVRCLLDTRAVTCDLPPHCSYNYQIQYFVQ